MKTVVINGCPRTNNDNTSQALAPFLDGMREAGAKITLYYTEKLKIKPCRDCKKCLYKTPGECYQRDDMQVVLPELGQAQVWVIAVPLTSDGISAPMKRLVARMLPLTKPSVQIRDNPTRYLNKLMGRLRLSRKLPSELGIDRAQDRSREGTKAGKLVLVSGCDDGELGDFDRLVQLTQSIAQRHQKEFAAALLRTHAGVMWLTSKADSLRDDVVTTAYEAGQQLVLNDTLRPDIDRRIQPLPGVSF